MTDRPTLTIVGEINPPDYKDPVKMLRNIADNIENGDYGAVDTLVVATFGDVGVDTFGGGKDSSIFHCAYLFGVAQNRLLKLPFGDEA